MKNYLSMNERNTWLSNMVLVMYNENLIEAWKNNLSKEELKKLRTSMTMTKNALMSISNRMPLKERNQIVKHSKDFEVRVTNTVGVKSLQRQAEKDMETVEVDRLEFEQNLNELIKLKCSNCKKKCDECSLYNFFDKTMMPRFETEKNCPYAFRTVEHKKLSRKERKTKNRFDDEDESYEYEIQKGVK